MTLETFTPEPLPANMRWLLQERGLPKVIKNALKYHGLREIPGPKHNPIILAMGDYLGGQVADWHKDDETPWCGVFAGFILKYSGYPPPAGFDVLRARKYADWGDEPKNPPGPALGDILSFWRGSPNGSDGHVGFYIAETPTTYIVYGGNQGNKVGFTEILKKRLLAARRCPWKIGQPSSVKPRYMNSSGRVSENEA